MRGLIDSVNVLQDGNVNNLVHIVGYLLLVHTGAGAADGFCKPAPLRWALVEKIAGWEVGTILRVAGRASPGQTGIAARRVSSTNTPENRFSHPVSSSISVSRRTACMKACVYSLHWSVLRTALVPICKGMGSDLERS